MQELKPTSLEWSEALESSVLTRPETKYSWVIFLISIIVFGLLILTGLRLLSFWDLGGLSILWVIPALALVLVGGYGAIRLVSSLFTPASHLQHFKLGNLELDYKLLPTQAPMYEVRVQGKLQVTLVGVRTPQTLVVSLGLNPDCHPHESLYLNAQTAKFDSGSYLFDLEIPRTRTLTSDLHCLLELKFANQVVFYRVMLETIGQSSPLKMLYQPSIKEQLEAFAAGNADELILKAYNGQSVSAGLLRHGGMPYVDQFSHDEKVAVFTIRFADLMDYLIKINWFADKIRGANAVKANSYFILREPEIYKVIYIEPDFHPFVYSEPGWSTVLHKTNLEREAFEAFLLHSDHSVLLLSGAQKLLEHRSDGDGAQHPQAH
jgi:hypothetical protein